jgi:hypothetical protein
MTVLRDELATDPLGLGYAALLLPPANPGLVAELLNAPARSGVQSRFLTARTVLAEMGAAGADLLDKLEAAAAYVPAVRWAMLFLKQEGGSATSGIDVGYPGTRSLIDQLAAGGLISTAEADALKALAIQPMSRARELGLPTVGVLDVIGAAP